MNIKTGAGVMPMILPEVAAPRGSGHDRQYPDARICENLYFNG
jgi:hypothetical protein